MLTWRQPGVAEDADEELAHPHLALFNREHWGLIIYDEVHLLPAPVFRATAEIQARAAAGPDRHAGARGRPRGGRLLA